ncbi:MAG: GNAT family N-acetyltransferase [Marinilabiliaceae bacterium]|nr:GNAT family N-acetyltransferase [Marinilabiliaceae bacterium]
MHFQEPRVVIRDILPADRMGYYELYSNPEVARYDDFAPIGLEELDADMLRISHYESGSLNREYAVSLPGDDYLMGVLTIDRRRKYCYLGYHFNPRFHGRGYALAAVRQFVSQQQASVRAVLRLVIDPGNAASIRLAEKAGFTKVGSRLKKGKREIVYAFK